jgi:hypothetical protein
MACVPVACVVSVLLNFFFFAGTVLLNLYAKISECFVASHRTVIVGWGELGLRNKKKKVLFGFNKQ